MKIISWNLNGLISSQKSGSLSILKDPMHDIICLQEIRTQEEPEIIESYHHFWNHSSRDGYSGTAVLTREEPIGVTADFPAGFDDDEGRLITVELKDIFLINAYVPNSQQNLRRQAYRMRWDAALYDYVRKLLEYKPVIICGDFNVARSDLDIYAENMRQYWAGQGYVSDERSNFETLLELGLTDTFRALYPDVRSYTWWSNRLNKRWEDRGWRLDYFLVSDELMPRVTDVRHLHNITGSDHCPISLEVAL